jgi:proline iminopeptidase
VPVLGATLNCVVEGAGLPVIVPGSDRYHRRTFSPQLREHLRLVFVNTRLFARSDISADELTLDTMVEDLEKVRKQLNLGKVAIMGHSMLAIVALEYAKKYPQNTSHLVMVAVSPLNRRSYDEALRYWELEASEDRKLKWEMNRSRLTEDKPGGIAPREDFIARYLADAPQRWCDPSYDSSWLWEGVHPNLEVSRHFTQVVFRDYDITMGLEKITMPVFLAVGKYDFRNPYYVWDDLKFQLPTFTIHLFHKSGHHPMLEESELFDQRLLEWFRAHS